MKRKEDPPRKTIIIIKTLRACLRSAALDVRIEALLCMVS